MKKFYEYNNEKIQEGVFEDPDVKNDNDSESSTNLTPIVGGATAVAGIAVAGYISWKAGKAILRAIHGGLGGFLNVQGTIAAMQNAGQISKSAEEFVNKVNGTYKATKSLYVTKEGISRAKDLHTVFKGFGVSAKSSRNAAIKLIMQAGKNSELAIKNLKLLQAEGKISEYAVTQFEELVKKPTNAKKIFKVSNAKYVKTGNIATRSAKVLINAAMRTGIPTKIAKTAAYKAVAKLLTGAAARTLGKALPGIGWAITAIEVGLWLAGDSDFYEPEEGWTNAKHGSPKLPDARKSYEMIGSSIVSSIKIISTGVLEYFKSMSDDQDVTNINYNYPSTYTRKNKISDEEGILWAHFVGDLDKRLTESEIVKNIEKVVASFKIINTEIVGDYSGINISGMRDAEDWSVIKNAANEYNLDSEDNAYGEEVAEDIGSILEYFFIPGLNAMGWATVFTSEQYLQSIKKEFNFPGSFNILELLYTAHNRINLMDLNYNSFNFNNFKSIMDLLLGDDFYETYRDVLYTLEYGVLQDGVWQKISGIDAYAETIGGIMNEALLNIKNDNKTFVMTKPILSIAAVFVTYVMLKDILKSGVKWLVNVEQDMIAKEVEDKAIEDEIIEGGIEDDAEEALENEELKKANMLDGRTTEPAVKKEDSNISKSEFSKISGFDDYL